MGETARKFGVYRQVFGPRGYWLALKTRLASEPYEETVRTPNGPLFLRLKTSDLNAYYKVLLTEDYDFPVAREPRVIIDAGANLGFAAVYFARKYPRAKIFAIEPERTNFELLERNVRAFPNITAIRGALWKEDGTMDLVDPGFGHWAFQVAENGAAGGSKKVEPVRTFTVATLLREHGIDHIDIFKIDIEGAEKELFENAGDWIERVGSVMIELHDRLKPGCTEAFSKATRDFTVEQTKGENIFRARANPAPGPSEPSERTGHVSV